MDSHSSPVAPGTADKATTARKTLAEQLTLWVGVVGTVVTIGLTLWNAAASRSITQKANELQAFEAQLKERATGIEESKERVDRYKWVLSLFPNLSDSDEQKRAFTISLMRLALTAPEAQQLFAGLQASPNQRLQAVGLTGITSLENEPIAVLISEMNAPTRVARRRATQQLISGYSSSSQAIDLVLDAYAPGRERRNSPSAVINGLVFLGATDPKAWSAAQIRRGRQVAATLRAQQAGPQTLAQIQALEALLIKAATTGS